MRQRNLARSTRAANDMSRSTFVSQNFVGAASSLGHSISSVSSPNCVWPCIGAARTRTRAKRDRSFALLPSRQQHTACNARLQSAADLLQRHLRLSLEPDGAWHVRLGAAGFVVGPIPWQIQLVGDRQAAMMIGDRQRHRHLAIGLLAELSAILMMHPDRMPPLLGK